MTEIKPGTPLPWLVGDGEDVWDTREDGEPGIPLFRADAGAYRSWGRTITRSELLADARYIVHTANTHPSLLNGLREAREAIREVVEGNVMDCAKVYRNDGVRSKHDQCSHGRFMYEGCSDCIDAFLDPVLAKLDTLLSQEGGK